MPRVGKREQAIRLKMGKKNITTLRKEIENGTIIVPDAKNYGMIPKYETPEQMQTLIDEYILEETGKDEPLTIAGLANKLGIDSNLVRLYGKKDGFSQLIEKYRQILLQSYESKMLKDPKSFNALKYYLENNFASKYSTKTTQDVNISGSISLVQLNREADKLLNATIIEGTIIE